MQQRIPVSSQEKEYQGKSIKTVWQQESNKM